jgi:hypothetical protein
LDLLGIDRFTRIRYASDIAPRAMSKRRDFVRHFPDDVYVPEDNLTPIRSIFLERPCDDI